MVFCCFTHRPLASIAAFSENSKWMLTSIHNEILHLVLLVGTPCQKQWLWQLYWYAHGDQCDITDYQQRESSGRGGWNTRLWWKWANATVTGEIRTWRLQSASKHKVNKARLGLKVSNRRRRRRTRELWETLSFTSLAGRVSTARGHRSTRLWSSPSLQTRCSVTVTMMFSKNMFFFSLFSKYCLFHVFRLQAQSATHSYKDSSAE